MKLQNLASRLAKWQRGIAAAYTASITIGLLNIVWLAVAVSESKEWGESGSRVLFNGDCSRTKTLSTALHLVINVLSTILLGATNYTQQCLAAPSREDIDLAHEKRDWLEIGVSSVRNLSRISKGRVVLLVCLALTSLPLHLLYNSVIYVNTGTYSYTVNPTTYEALTNPDFTYADQETFSKLRRDLSDFERLSNAECIAAYGKPFVQDRGDVIPIIDPQTSSKYPNYTDVFGGAPLAWQAEPFGWICTAGAGWTKDSCDVEAVAKNPDNWTITAQDYRDFNEEAVFQVQYCLSEPKPERCELHFSVPFMAVVIFFNLGKALCMYLTFRMLRRSREAPLITIGDAITSFLTIPDPATEGRCLYSAEDFRKRWSEPPKPKQWHPITQRAWKFASRGRWLFTTGSCLTAVIIATAFFGLAVQHVSYRVKSFGGLWDMGFGAVSTDAIINFDRSSLDTTSPSFNAAGMVLIANLPQLVLSVLYFANNSLWTSMHVGMEWASYALTRKGLRTSHPRGAQRSTYWLSLPKMYAIPLVIVSAILHWLISQSLFFVRLTVYATQTRDGGPGISDTVTTCGYSAIALFFVLIVGFIALVAPVIAGYRKVHQNIPVDGTNSAVLSAACHRPEDDEHAAVLPILWGCPAGGEKGYGEVQHCCLTSGDVEPPVQGAEYM